LSKFFIEEGETVKRDFPDGNSVQLRTELTQEARDRIKKALVEARTEINPQGKTAGEKVKTSVGINPGQLQALEEYIAGWTFTEDGGKVVPVNRENINLLRTRYREMVITWVNELTAQAEAFEKNS